MSMKMSEADWEITLDVFRACLPARGAKARDDRTFLEALHFFAVHNISWRALPERFGKWNTVWKRFDRLSKAGVFEDFFAMLAGLSRHGAPVRKRHRMPFSTRRSSTRGTPRGLFGNSGWMIAHSSSLSS